MSNWNTETFDNIYANLAQGAYNGRPVRFVTSSLRKDQQERLFSGKSVQFDFSKSVKKGNQAIEGGQNLPNDGIVGLKIIN
ncbi:hypothetical protein [Streptococcus agalactiae]|uniref:hypothetical protein n=1 Tax=Streptococcus agalactiae TaxID=1311 RepID=UPI003C74EC07